MCKPAVSWSWVILCLLFFTASLSARTLSVDICVYGGTSGGVVAAVQAARMGKTAVLLEPGEHLGGMSASGLSWTDVGASDRAWAVGGMAREFYERVGKHYGQDPKTVFAEQVSTDKTRQGYDFPKPPSLSFEPKVAELVFQEMLAEAKVPVHFQAELEDVAKKKGRLTEIRTKSGLRIRAKMFIDASYEGDLMARAGVTWTLGREANSQYGETVNGVQGPAESARSGKFEVAIDPYRVPGQPESGLLPYLLQPGALEAEGTADRRIQSYNFRVCLTDVATNRLPLAPPANYDPANYELLSRWTEARVAAGKKLTLRDYLKYDPLQNGKYDFNNRWPISTDFIGGADEYPTASTARRAEIARAHEDYLRGFLHFLATSPRVPEAVRKEMARFGLPKDEFVKTGGWPHQLYVREARRLVGDFVMVERHCTGEHIVPRPIGMGAYGMDMHAVRRVVVNGQPVNEGTKAKSVPAPYGIGYGAVLPKTSECENLLVTFAVSASHVAFGSIRMEPVHMVLSQSAATAASLAVDRKCPVQAVPYEALAKQLKADGQVLGKP